MCSHSKDLCSNFQSLQTGVNFTCSCTCHLHAFTLQVRVARDHEEKVLFLLNKLQQKSSTLGSGEINRIHEAEINQFSKLHEELRKMGEENERLKGAFTYEVC